jgi:hypothetical protein
LDADYPRKWVNIARRFTGEGPEEAIRCGRKVLYPVRKLVAWLEKRSKARVIPSPEKNARGAA